MRWQCRIAPSLGALEGHPDETWRTKPYLDEFQDTIFFGLYGFPDFYTLWRHRGRKCILWAGSDIQHFLLGYWLDDEGKMRIHPTQLSAWLDTNCESYVENEVEQAALRSVGVRSRVVPSFLGDVSKYGITYEVSPRPKLYTSVSGNNFELYRWDKILPLAQKHPHIEFHLYGNTSGTFVVQDAKNVFDHGRVPKEEMNKEIMHMQGALRLTTFDGFSEIIAKSLLWGQWPVSHIEYPHTLRASDHIVLPTEPNKAGREWLLEVVNKYPWNNHV